MRTDLLLDADGDLPIDTLGLMPVGFSDFQHQEDMFEAYPGEWKQFPFNGIGVGRYLKSQSNATLTVKKIARQQLNADGYATGVINVSYTSEGKLLIRLNTPL